MVEIITGARGSGKTKTLIDEINKSVATTTGCLVCIEKDETLRRAINYKVRWCSVEQFGIAGHEAFYGFIAGMLAGNYDIKEIFVDGILRICGRDFGLLAKMFEEIDKLTGCNTKVVFTVSADIEGLPEVFQKWQDNFEKSIDSE